MYTVLGFVILLAWIYDERVIVRAYIKIRKAEWRRFSTWAKMTPPERAAKRDAEALALQQAADAKILAVREQLRIIDIEAQAQEAKARLEAELEIMKPPEQRAQEEAARVRARELAEVAALQEIALRAKTRIERRQQIRDNAEKYKATRTGVSQ
jgi:hypothetical protein